MTDNPFTPGPNEPSDHHNPNRSLHENRDEILATRLNNDPVPDHGPFFWSDLQTSLEAEASSAAPGTITPSTPTQPENNVVPLAGRSRRRRMPMVLSAAAAVLALAMAAVVLIDRVDDTTPITTADETGPTDGTDAEGTTDGADAENTDAENTDGADAENTDAENTGGTADPEESSGDGETEVSDNPMVRPQDFTLDAVTSIGTGSFVAFTPDGRGVLTIGDAASGALGCEGSPLLELTVHDFATGERRSALPDGMTIETGGIDFRFQTAGTAGPVAFVEYCDGVVGDAWSGTIAPDGTIGDVSPTEIDDADNPVGYIDDAQARFPDARAFTPDGSAGFFIDERGLRVATLDSKQTWNAPDTLSGTAATFDPSGQVAFITSDLGLWLWNYRSAELVDIPYTGGYSPQFNEAGDQLVVNRFSDNGDRTMDVLTFNGAPVPTGRGTPTPVSCSGDIGLEPLDAGALAGSGIPEAVAATVAAVDAAAAICDWSALDALQSANFTASFGGDPALDLWQTREEEGYEPLGDLRLLLRQPVGVLEAGGPLYVWPGVHARACEDFTDEDLQSLTELGYSQAAIDADCEVFGGYGGYRMGFDSSGDWLFYVVGD